MSFFSAVAEFPFLQHALIAGLLASLSCGIVGTYVVVRRISFIAGGIAHCVLAGLGAARYFQVVHGWEAFTPQIGAVVAALLAAVIIGMVSLRAREREDTIIGAVWATGMAIGILFISKTPGYNEDLMSYLFGNILLVGTSDLWVMLILDLVVIGTVVFFFDQFQAVCFDEEFARLRGLNVELYTLILLCLIALTVVLMVSVVGIVLVIALLTLPVAVAGHFTRSLRSLMILSVGISAAFTSAGLMLSFEPDLPTGATTIAVAGASYLIVLALKWSIRRSKQ